MSSDKWCAECGASSIDTDGETIGHTWHCCECAHVIHNGDETEEES